MPICDPHKSRMGRPFGVTGHARPALTGGPRPKGVHMQVCQAREQYVRWLLVTQRSIAAHDPRLRRRHHGVRAPSRRPRARQADRSRAPHRLHRGRSERPGSPRRRSGVAHRVCVVSAGGCCHAALLEARPLGRHDRRCRPVAQAASHLARARARSPLPLPSPDGRRNDASNADVVLRRPHESTTLLAVALMVATGSARQRGGERQVPRHRPARPEPATSRQGTSRAAGVSNERLDHRSYTRVPQDACRARPPASSPLVQLAPRPAHGTRDATRGSLKAAQRRGSAHQGDTAHVAAHRRHPTDRGGRRHPLHPTPARTREPDYD